MESLWSALGEVVKADQTQWGSEFESNVFFLIDINDVFAATALASLDLRTRNLPSGAFVHRLELILRPCGFWVGGRHRPLNFGQQPLRRL